MQIARIWKMLKRCSKSNAVPRYSTKLDVPSPPTVAHMLMITYTYDKCMVQRTNIFIETIILVITLIFGGPMFVR